MSARDIIAVGHERVLLAAMINGKNGALNLSVDDFSSPPNQLVFKAAKSLPRKRRNLLSVQDVLRKRGQLASVGGAAGLTEIACETISPEIVKYSHEEVLKDSRQRRATRVGNQLYKGDITPDEALEQLSKLRPADADAGEREPRIRFFAPTALRDYRPDHDIVLIGDCAVMRGETFVVAGEPSVGKSLAATQLAVSGATQRDWFGLEVHCQFRTMIVQTENGRFRLRQEYSALDCCDELEDFIRVSEPPPFGLTLTNKEFQENIGAALDSFKPDCVIFDPWNAAARDDKMREYAETFDALRNLLPTGADKPALGIIAHTRKPQLNEKRTGGTALMHLLAGSYILTSVPRCLFVMTRGSQDETDDTVVFFNPKNSNGENAPRSAWHRKLSGFTPAKDFDWKEFDKSPEERKTITIDHVREVFANGEKRLELKEAAHDLATLVNVTESAAYNALKPDGKFSAHISRSNGMLTFHSTKFPSKTH